MSVYALTALGKADIFDIWSYLAADSEQAANRVEQAIFNDCAFVDEGPLRGHSRPGLTTRSLRFLETPPVILTTPLFAGPRQLPFRLSPFCTGKELYGAS